MLPRSLYALTPSALRRRRALALALSAAACLLLMPGGADAQSDDDAAARNAATAWLQQLDASRWADTWRNAATMFQDAVPQATWERAIQSTREPLGGLQTRTESAAKSATSLPGVPDGRYLILTYHSSFAHKQRAVETVATVLQPDGHWKVAGYFVK